MQPPTLLDVGGCLFAGSKAMGGNRAIHVEQLVRVCGKGRIALAGLRHGVTRPAKPRKIIVRRLDEVLDILRCKKIRDRAACVKGAPRKRVRRGMNESLFATGANLPTERIEPANQRAIGMDRAALRAEKNTGAVFRAGKMKALAVLRKTFAKLRRSDATVRRQTRDLVRIELDELVVTAMRAPAADKAERLGAVFRRKILRLRHELICSASVLQHRKNRVDWKARLVLTLVRMSQEKSYVIGTHDAEIERLGVQHRVWRASVLDLWRQGGITSGQIVLDIGAGPGHAALDLAEIVGHNGKVIALERSHRFLSALTAFAAERGLTNIETIETDLLEYEWPESIADRAWCRWVLAFVNDPAKVLRDIARALRPGGKLLIQEYYDYASWHLAPRSPLFEDYVAKIIAKWRASGGDSDVGLALPHLLPEAGLEIESVRPAVFTARMNDFAANWPMDFARQYIPVMVEDGDLDCSEGEAVAALLDRAAADPNSLVITPGLLQIVARKR